MQVLLLLIFAALFRKSTHSLYSLGCKPIEPVLTFIKIISDNENRSVFVWKDRVGM